MAEEPIDMMDRLADADTEAGRGEGLRIVFDGPPSHEAGRFVEVEDATGRSVNAGTWHERDDGLWELRLRQSDPGGEPVAWALYAVTPNGRFSQDVYFDRERIEEVNRRTNWTYESEIVPLYAAPTDEAPEGRECICEGGRAFGLTAHPECPRHGAPPDDFAAERATPGGGEGDG